MKATDFTCKEVVEALGDFMADSLEDEDRARIEQHLRGCSGCTTHLDQLHRTVELMAQLAEPSVPTKEAMTNSTELFRRWAQQRASGVRVIDTVALFREWKQARGR